MIKELLLAILLGALLGFGATGSILTLRQKPAPQPQPTPTTSPTQTTPTLPSPTISTISSTLVINSPPNNSVVNSAKIELKGTTDPNNLVLVRTPLKTAIATADNNGNFIIDVELDSGLNPISVASVDPDTNNQSTTQIYLTYSTAKL